MSTNMMSRAGGGTTTANAAAAAPANDAAEYSKNMAGKKKKATFECQHCAPNAQSALNTAHNLDPEPADQSHDFSDVNNKATSPVDMKPIPVNGLGDGLMSIATNVNLPHNGGNLNATANDGENPEREWSISPPPLSSAYDYWYQHGCLPHTVRNPASVSGSGSSGATSPAMSNALELAPGQMQHHQRTYMESPTTFYTPHSMHHHNGTGITTPTNANGAYAFEGENTATAMRTSYPLGTATFPTAAEYQHAAPSSHQRSHSHSSYTLAAPYNPGTTPTAGGSYNASASSPTVQTHPSTFHGHHHSHSADSRPVTRHGSMGASNPYSLPVYPSHPHSGMPYGVVDMPSQAAPHPGHYSQSPVQRHSMPNSPRMSTSHVQPTNSSSSSLVLPPIRFADGEMSMGGHFTSGNGWERVNISDARALPPQGAPGMAR
ncbi:2920_t:CDS:2 [Acaulospora colombiana]|uniref:2920_t:CDS:1 n=1 Tax=Acaulospora colombiana TaxID=27376 RepID=A0ACA9NF44_9GLOM|nr:2920_t:CDS:2 [Acaulospora colombiana]